MDNNKECKKKIFMILLHDFVYPFLDARVFKEANSLVNDGYDVTVLCWSGIDKNKIKENHYEKIKIKRFPKKTMLSQSMSKTFFLYFYFIFNVLKFVSKEKPAVIHCHDLDTLLAGVLLKILKKTLLVYDAHEDFSCTYEAMYPDKKWVSNWIRIYEKILIKFPDRVIAAESGYTQNFKKYYGITPEIIKNFPDIDFFNPTGNLEPVITEAVLKKKVIITQIGAISPNRGLLESLEALKSLRDKVFLILIGSVSESNQKIIDDTIKKEGLSDSIQILPKGIEHRKTPAYYRASYATIALLHPIPAYLTSVPTKLYESIACGVPVIAADNQYIREIVEKYQVGLCVNSQDPSDITEKISWLIQNPDIREKMSENCMNLAKTKLNWKISESQLLKIYHTICPHKDADSQKRVVTFLTCDFIHPFVHPRVFKEAISLTRNGYEVTVVCWCRSDKKLPKFEEYNGIKVIRIFQKEVINSWPFCFRALFYCHYIIESIIISINIKPDIIHCNDLDTLGIGVSLKVLIKKPVIFDSFEEYPLMWRAMYPNSQIIFSLLKIFEKYSIKFADNVIIAEKLYSDNIERKYKIIPHLVCNYPNLQYFNPSVDCSSIVEQFKLKNNIIVSVIGGIGDTRAINELLEAMQFVTAENVKLFLIGKTTKEDSKKIELKISKLNLKDKIILLLEGVKYEEIPKFYKASDITVALLYPIPTYITSVPTKLYESLAVGVPVIAANNSQIKHIVDKFHVGFCVDSKNVKDITDKLNLLINDKQLRQNMGGNGLIVAQQLFNWNISEKELLKVYEDVT
ncbi:MAG: glycosyltransferase family 4 protein [Methanoregula sp.]